MDRVPREGLDPTSTLFLHSEGTSAEAWSVDTQRANPGLHGFTASRRNAVAAPGLQRVMLDWRQVFGPEDETT